MPRNVSADDDAFFAASREASSFSSPSARSAFSSRGFSLSSAAVGLVAVAGALVSAPSRGPSSASTAARRRGRRARRRAEAASSPARSAVPFFSPSRRRPSDAEVGAPQRASVAKSSANSSSANSSSAESSAKSSAKASPLRRSSRRPGRRPPSSASAPPKHATSAPATRRASRHAAASARATSRLAASEAVVLFAKLLFLCFPLSPSRGSVALRSAARTHARLVCKKTRNALSAARFSAATSAASASATSSAKLFKTSARPERAAREICARNDSRSGACCLTRGNARTSGDFSRTERTSRAARNRRAAETRSRASRDPQIFSGVSTRNFTRVPAAYRASSSRDGDVCVSTASAAPRSMDATASGSAVKTRTASSSVVVARAAVVSISSTQSAVAMASLYEDPTRCLSSSSFASASRAARARTSRISSKLLDSNRASALRSFSARLFASPEPRPPAAAGSAGATIVATGAPLSASEFAGAALDFGFK